MNNRIITGFIFFTLLLLCNLIPLSLISQRYFDKRAKKILFTYDTSATSFIYKAIRSYQKGKIKEGDSIALLSHHFRKPQYHVFWSFTIAYLIAYRQANNNLQNDHNSVLIEKIKYWFKNFKFEIGNTENLELLYHISFYLLGKNFPEIAAEDWIPKKKPEDIVRLSRKNIIKWADSTITLGQTESDSPTYFPEYMFSMALLFDFAPDDDIRKLAGQIMDLLLIDFATDHLDGMMLGGHSREDSTAVYKPKMGNASEFAYLYFGKGVHQSRLTWCVFLNALSSYKPPRFIEQIANNKKSSFLNLEKRRSMKIIKPNHSPYKTVYKTTYRTPNYGLSSFQGDVFHAIQQHIWSVRFKSTKPYSTIFGIHPHWSEEILSLFLEPQKDLLAIVAKQKITYTNPNKWTGSSPYERIFQFKNNLIALYDIPTHTQTEHIDLFFPKTLDKRISLPSGWIACKAGKTYIGVYPLQYSQWLCLKSDEYNYRLRSDSLKNGYIVFVRSRKEIGSFQRFCKKLSVSLPVKHFSKNQVSVKIRTLENDALSFVYPNNRMVNDSNLTFDNWKLSQSPFTLLDKGILQVFWKKRTYTYDLISIINKLKIKYPD